MQREVILEVAGNSYPIKLPNMGQLIEIEMIKAQITNGTYGQIVGNMSALGVMSLDMVDMIATLNVLCPTMLSDMKVDNWAQLDVFDILEIYRGYAESVSPWFKEFSTKVLEVWNKSTDSLTKKESSDEKEPV